MSIYLPYILMSAVSILVFILIYYLHKQRVRMESLRVVCWISLSAYFLIEYIVIRATTAPYNFLEQPMSDLGVTACGTDTYLLASYDICSPYHLLMNWTFTLTGIAIAVGAIALHPLWPSQKKTRFATILLVVYGLSYTISGIVPADVNFLWHTLGSIPGMIVQIPALLMIGFAIRKTMPALSFWTFLCALLTTSALILLFYQPLFINLPGGLLQRILYGSVYLWMTVTAIVLWCKPSLEPTAP